MGNCCGSGDEHDEVLGDSYVRLGDEGSAELGGSGGSRAFGSSSDNARESKAKLARDHAKSTFRPLKSHKDASRAALQKATLATLGSGDLKGAVRLPQGLSRDEWIAVHPCALPHLAVLACAFLLPCSSATGVCTCACVCLILCAN